MSSRKLIGLTAGMLALACLMQPVAAQQGRGGFSIPALLMTTDAFEDGGIIPPRFSARGGNTQPGFTIANAPDGTVCYAIIMHDMDVAIGGGTDGVLHWMAWNIPAAAGAIPEGGLPEGSVLGRNIAGQNAYFGPGAPPGPRNHHYAFELYALNAKLELPADANRAALIAAMAGKVVAKAAYVGRFGAAQ